jgi:hypothetical protein
MAGALNRIFGEIAEFSKTMGSLHTDFLNLVQRDIERFLEKTKDLNNQMFWQGWTTIGLTSLSGSFAIAGAIITKASPTGDTNAASSLNSRLGANDGIANGFSNAMKAITQKLSDNDFLRSTCKTTSKFFNGVSPAADAWYRSTTTEIESKRSLLERVNLQDGQTKKSMFDQQVQQAQQAALRLLESKSKGG